MLNIKPKILFVEDEADLIDIYHLIFENHGYAFYSTADIDEALLITQTEQPAVVLLDIILPKTTGGTVDISAKQGFVYLEKVKKNPKTKKIPVVVLTNLNNTDDRKKAKNLGALDYIVKADNLPEQVFTKVERVIKASKK